MYVTRQSEVEINLLLSGVAFSSPQSDGKFENFWNARTRLKFLLFSSLFRSSYQVHGLPSLSSWNISDDDIMLDWEWRVVKNKHIYRIEISQLKYPTKQRHFLQRIETVGLF